MLFRCENDSETAPRRYIEQQREHMCRIKDLTLKEPYFTGVDELYDPMAKKHKTLHEWLKEGHSQDSRIHQQIMANLPHQHKKLYFREKNADVGYVSGTGRTRVRAKKAGDKRFQGETWRTDDVFGKDLHEMGRLPEKGLYSTPTIFWILAGYFRKNDSQNMKTQGLFRITSVGEQLRELETHLSQGNFAYLERVTDPHLVANHWKRLLREMKEPLFSYSDYKKYLQLAGVNEKRRLIETQILLDDLKE